MSESPHQSAVISAEYSEEDAADEYVVIHQGDEEDSDKCSTTSETTNQSMQNNSSGKANSTLSTMADIGKGLDGDDADGPFPQQHTPMSCSYAPTMFNSSFFGAFGEPGMSDQLRELVRTENEQNRAMLDHIKGTLLDLAKEKSSNNELLELITIKKNLLMESQQKLDSAVQAISEKDANTADLEENIRKLLLEKKEIRTALDKANGELMEKNAQVTIMQGIIDSAEQSNALKDVKIGELEGLVQKLLLRKDELALAADKSKDELANKDEIIKVLREQCEEQQRMHETRAKMWRQRVDELEQRVMVDSYRDRGEVNNCG